MHPHANPSISYEDYRRLPGINSSLLKAVDALTPAHAWSKYLDPEAPPPVDAAALIIGNAVHTLVLEREQWEQRYAFPPEDAPKRPTDAQRNAAKPSAATTTAIEFWDAFDAAAAGKTILSRDHVTIAASLEHAIRIHPVLGPWFASPSPLNEISLSWVDPSGAECKARLDAVRIMPDHIRVLDLKTTQDGSPREFARSVIRYGYLLQGAFYADAAAACRGAIAELQGLPSYALDGMPIVFEFIAAEKAHPYLVARYELTDDQMAIGRERYQKALAAVHAADATGYWPGYDTAALPLELPGWFK
jgi:hypothetical protein